MPDDRTIWLLAVLTIMLLIASTAGCSLEYEVRRAAAEASATGQDPAAAGSEAAIRWWVDKEL